MSVHVVRHSFTSMEMLPVFLNFHATRSRYLRAPRLLYGLNVSVFTMEHDVRTFLKISRLETHIEFLDGR